MDKLLKLLEEVEEKARVCEAALPGKLKEVDDEIEKQISQCSGFDGRVLAMMVESIEKIREQNRSYARWELTAALENVEYVKRLIKGHQEHVKQIPKMIADIFK
jgi:hypothetical protein